jgi:O-antigen ligase
VYPAYAHFDVGASVDHAHNDWLEWAAEGGIPHALAWAVLAVSVAKPAVRSIWGIGVMAVFLHAFVDYPFARFGVSAWTMTLIGALCADGMREVPVRAH